MSKAPHMFDKDTTDKAWHDKAARIVRKHAEASWRAANVLPNGRTRKRHVPYTLPAICEALIAAMYKDDEYEAKRLFIIDEIGAYTLI